MISRVKLRRSEIRPLAICIETPHKIISVLPEEPTTPAEMVEILKK